MFCFIRKKRWQEMEEQLQNTLKTATDCQSRLEHMQRVLETGQSKITGQVSDHADAVMQNITLAYDGIKAVLEGQNEAMLAQRTAGQETHAKLFEKLDSLQKNMIQLQERLDSATKSSIAIQEAVRTNGEQTSALLKRCIKYIQAQETLVQNKHTELLRKLDATAELSEILQEMIQASEEQTTAGLVQLGKELSEQLLLLDESSRLLLLHMVMNELDVK